MYKYAVAIMCVIFVVLGCVFQCIESRQHTSAYAREHRENIRNFDEISDSARDSIDRIESIARELETIKRELNDAEVELRRSVTNK